MTSQSESVQSTLTSLPVTAAEIDAAAARLEGIVNRTPLQLCHRLAKETGANILVKREDLQPVRSYKIRGAYNLISQLTPDQRAKGVICASAGNHGQGVALACANLGVKGMIFVPSTTPRQKRERMEALGGAFVTLMVTGETYDDSSRAAREAADEFGMVMVPAFDDVRTIAGQGTVAIEIVEQLGEAPDVVIVPVGGGGMIAGIATWLAENCPETKVIGVEPEGAACMQAALAHGEPVVLENIDTFVDGAAVRKAGAVPFEILSKLDVEFYSVPEGKVCSEMLELYQADGIIAEPAGALATSVLGLWNPEPGEKVVCILSGGNNDVSRYAEVIERALIHEGLKHYFLVNFPQEPGALRRFLEEVLGPGDDITHFEYVKKNNRELGPALVGIELSSKDDFPGLIERMDSSNLDIEIIDPQTSTFRYIVN